MMDKVAEYSKAMEKYYSNPFYYRMGYLVSSLIIPLQALSIFLMVPDLSISTITAFGIFILAYVLTDLVNGFIHMVMDNNTNYTSFTGPFVAAFHLHHKQPKYRDRNLLRVYFDETGSKFWLAGYMVLLVTLQVGGYLGSAVEFLLVSFAVLSSFAEVSHYLCHNSKTPMINILRRLGILLSPVHHSHHHSKDNVNYAFLNGMTDPLLNIIARGLFPGYKSNADLHARNYVGPQTGNRA